VEAAAFHADGIIIGLRGGGLYAWDSVGWTWWGRGFARKAVTSITVDARTQQLWVTVRPFGAETTSAVVYRSDDGGVTWQPSDGGLSAATGFHGLAWSVGLDPTDPGRMFLGQAGNISRSLDTGRTWSEVYGSVLSPGVAMAPVVVSRASPARVWAGGMDGLEYALLLRSDDGGDAWQRLGVRDHPVDAYASLLADPSNANRLLVGMNARVRVTEDAGASWTTVLKTGTPGFVTQLQLAGPGVVALAERHTGTPGETKLALFLGSRDATSWMTLAVPPSAAGGTEMVVRDDGLALIGTRNGAWMVRLW
jgi:photosystem II stability/assembly factor-like uncharacterized protein